MKPYLKELKMWGLVISFEQKNPPRIEWLAVEISKICSQEVVLVTMYLEPQI